LSLNSPVQKPEKRTQEMCDNLHLSLPSTVDSTAVLGRLDRVLDPELDESILKLGFVESLEMERGRLTVDLRLPTYWCAPNFSYLMAEDVRRELLTVENVDSVTVRLKDHFAADTVAAGVNTGKSFAQAFPGEALGNLDQLRALFIRKGYIRRQERLLRGLLDAGLTFMDMAHLKIEDVRLEGDFCEVRCNDGNFVRAGPREAAERYLQRRADLGIETSQTSPLVTDLRGEPVAAQELEKYFVQARTVRVSLEANGALCCSLLSARQAARRGGSEDTKEH